MRTLTNGWKRSGFIMAVTMLLALATAGSAWAAGGTFSATNTGTSARSHCGLLTGLTACIIRLNGTGTATFLGPVSESGKLTADLSFLSGVLGGCGAAFGTITLTSQSTPTNSVRFAVRGQVCKTGLIGLGASNYSLAYTVAGGTGMFSHATGSGQVVGQADSGFLTGRGHYSDQFNGTLNF